VVQNRVNFFWPSERREPQDVVVQQLDAISSVGPPGETTATRAASTGGRQRQCRCTTADRPASRPPSPRKDRPLLLQQLGGGVRAEITRSCGDHDHLPVAQAPNEHDAQVPLCRSPPRHAHSATTSCGRGSRSCPRSTRTALNKFEAVGVTGSASSRLRQRGLLESSCAKSSGRPMTRMGRPAME